MEILAAPEPEVSETVLMVLLARPSDTARVARLDTSTALSAADVFNVTGSSNS